MKLPKLISKDKKYILQFSILPIFSILLIAFIYSKVYIQNITFGVVDHDNTTLSRTIVQQLNTHPGINVNYYTDSEDQLAEAIKKRIVNGGIVIPKGFYQDTLQRKSPSVALIIDGTNTVVGGNLSGYCSTVLSNVNAQLQLGILEGNKLPPNSAMQAVTSFSFGERVLYDSQMGYLRYLGYMFVPLTVQMIFLTNFLIPTLIEERKKFYSVSIRSKEGLQQILTLLARILLLISLLIITSFLGLCVVGKLYNLPLRGSILLYAVLMFILLINLTAMGFVFASFVDNQIYFIMFLGMVNLVIIQTSLVPWPAYMIPAGSIRVVKSVWPFIHAALPLKYLNLKGAGWSVLLPYIKEGLLYTLFWLPTGIGLYSARIGWQKHQINKRLKF